MTRDITCINCPLGCPLTVTLENNVVKSVSGAACKRGNTYAELECTNPTRVVTSTVPVKGSDLKMISVKTADAIPKSKISDCLKSLIGIEKKAPVKIGDIVVENVCGTGVNIIATRNARSI